MCRVDTPLTDGYGVTVQVLRHKLRRVSPAAQLAQAIHTAFRRMVGTISEWHDHKPERMLSTLWGDKITGKGHILDWMDVAQHLWGDGLSGALGAAMETS